MYHHHMSWRITHHCIFLHNSEDCEVKDIFAGTDSTIPEQNQTQPPSSAELIRQQVSSEVGQYLLEVIKKYPTDIFIENKCKHVDDTQ